MPTTYQQKIMLLHLILLQRIDEVFRPANTVPPYSPRVLAALRSSIPRLVAIGDVTQQQGKRLTRFIERRCMG